MSTLSVGGTMITLRSNRIVLLGFIALFLTTLYFFYPSDHFKSPHTPLDPYGTYEAGGIDSDHWLEPVIPKFENEVARDDCDEGECDAGMGRKMGAVKERVKGIKRPDKLADEKKKAQAALDVPVEPAPAVEKPVLRADDSVLTGGAIMPKMENATAKAELGRAAWRVLHLMTLRYPETPSPDDRAAFKSYFTLFARMYPCGDCAREFQTLLKQYPPQTSSRKTASMWLCSVHNVINERLGKPEFDCLTLNDVYDCGCGPDGEEGTKDTAVDGVKKAGDKAAVVKDKVAAVKDKAVNKAAVKDKAAAKDTVDTLPAVKDKLVGVKDQVKAKINAVKEKGKEVVQAAAGNVLPGPKARPNPNRPLGGMNAKEKDRDGAQAKVGEEKKHPLDDQEVVFDPKNAKGEVIEPGPEVEVGRKAKEVHKAEPKIDEDWVDLPDEEEPADDEEEEEEEQAVRIELSSEDEEAEEDDSDLLEAEDGEEDEFNLDSDELDDFIDGPI